MTREPRWIGKRVLLMLHEESLATFGGAPGLRDEGLLDSALARPPNAYAYNPKCTLAVLAACYAFGLAKNHAFVDGNKRISFLSIGLFLGVNGQRLEADPVDAIRTTIRLAASEIDEPKLAAWILQNAVLR